MAEVTIIGGTVLKSKSIRKIESHRSRLRLASRHAGEGVSLTELIRVGRPTHYGWHHSLGWDLGLYKKEEVSWAHPFTALNFLTMATVATCLWLLQLWLHHYEKLMPQTGTLNWDLKLWSKINLFFFNPLMVSLYIVLGGPGIDCRLGWPWTHWVLPPKC